MSKAEPIPSLSFPREWRQVPIHESGEKLISPTRADGIFPNPQYFLQGLPGALHRVWIREGVMERLLKVVDELLLHDLSLSLFDGWRPLVLQAALFARQSEAIHRMRPDLAGDELIAEVSRYVSEPSLDLSCPSPHVTGGAIDLTLCDRTGNPVEMGSAFDAFAPAAATRYFEEQMAQKNRQLQPREQEALTNRRVLFAAMAKQGFTSYPEEWWHFDYGDQFWGAISGNPARYGAILPPASAGDSSPETLPRA